MKSIAIIFLFLLSCICFSQPVIYGHRGARGLAPENTLPGYQLAILQGVDYVDLDITMTKDNVIIVQHDLTLNPDLTRDKYGHWLKSNNLIVKNLTLSQLQHYDVGQINPKSRYSELFPNQKSVLHTSIPTLKSVIHAVKQQAGKRVGFQIEIKTDPTRPELSVAPQKLVSALEKIIREEGIIQRTKIQSYDWGALQQLQRINPQIQTAYITDIEHEKVLRNPNPAIAGQWTGGQLLKNYHYSIPTMIKALGGCYWDVQDIAITPAQIQEAHRLGLKVVVWSWPEKTGKTIDIPLLRQLIADDIDGIITDRPDIVVPMLAQLRNTYLPIQKLEKISPSKSSEVNSPVISLKAR